MKTNKIEFFKTIIFCIAFGVLLAYSNIQIAFSILVILIVTLSDIIAINRKFIKKIEDYIEHVDSKAKKG